MPHLGSIIAWSDLAVPPPSQVRRGDERRILDTVPRAMTSRGSNPFRSLALRLGMACIEALIITSISRYLSAFFNAIIAWPPVQTLAIWSTLVDATKFPKMGDNLSSQAPSRRVACTTLIYSICIQIGLAWGGFRQLMTYERMLWFSAYRFRGLVTTVFAWINRKSPDATSIADITVELIKLSIFLQPMTTLKVCAAFALMLATLVFLDRMQPRSGLLKALLFIADSTVQFVYVSVRLAGVNSVLQAIKETAAKRQRATAVLAQQTASTLPPVPYTRLSHRHIRLLYLSQEAPFSVLRVTMCEVLLDWAPPYEAISHAWDYPVNYVPMRTNGNFRLMVPYRVYQCFRHCQSYFSPCYMWVDALCIDQDSLEERAAQIALMKEIFSRATRVVAWLAAPAEAPEARLVRSHLWFVRVVQTLYSDHRTIARLTNGRSKDLVAALQPLLRNRWFTRRFMVQEVALPPKVHLMYGSCCIDWSDLACFVAQIKEDGFADAHAEVTFGEPDKTITEKPRGPRRGLVNILSMANIRAKLTQGRLACLLRRLPPHDRNAWLQANASLDAQLCLENILTATFAFETTEAHDKFYSLIGLIEDPAAAVPIPDYRLSFQDVYMGAARLLLTRGDRTKLSLCLAGIGIRRSIDAVSPAAVPSWLPDYFTSMESLACVSRHWGHPGQPSLTASDNNCCMAVQTRLCASVQTVGPCLGDEDNTASAGDRPGENEGTKMVNWFHKATQFVKTAHATFHEQQGDDAFQEAFWRALLTDTYQDEYPISANTVRYFVQQGELWEQLRLAKLGQPNNLEELLANGNGPDRHEMNRTMLPVVGCASQRIAFTDSGHFMLVPPFTKEGDIVGFMRGDDWPYVFRQVESSQSSSPPGIDLAHERNRRVNLVGSAFIEGVPYPGDDEDQYRELVLV